MAKKTKNSSERHRKIRGLIVWLSKETQVSTALDRILGEKSLGTLYRQIDRYIKAC